MSISSSKQDLFAAQSTPDAVDLGSINEAQELEILLADHSIVQEQQLSRQEVLQCIVCNKRIPKARRAAILGVQTCIKDQAKIDNNEINLADYL
jgi:RNA polymerase-binding transcription factor DksA